MAAAAVTALPLVGLVAYASVDRYDADKERATRGAATRAELYAALAGERPNPGVASQQDLAHMVTLSPLLAGGVLDFYRDGRVIASTGAVQGNPPADNAELRAAVRRGSGTFTARGADGAVRVFGVARVKGTPLRVLYGRLGSDVYGPSEAALKRDILLAALVSALAIGTAFLLAGRMSRPIRRLAARVGGERVSANDIGVLERGIDRMGETIEESQVELTRRAERLEALNEELRDRERSASQLAAIVESSGDAIVSKTLDGTITSWNAGAERLYGYSPEEIIGKNISVLVPPGSHDELPAILEQIRAGAPLGRFESPRITKDGRLLQMSLTFSPLYDEHGELVGASTIARDATRRKVAEEELRRLNEELEDHVQRRTEELAQVNEDLEAFSYSVSHDLRAPLRAIDGFSRLVIEDYGADLPADAQRYLGLVSKNTQDMGLLIDGLLAFSKLGHRTLERRPLDVEALVHEVAERLAEEVDGADPAISIGALPEANADPVLLRQVFANLLSNAIKFTRDTEQPKIEVASAQDNGSRVYLVRDNGVGFDMRYADKLFTVFQRLHRVEDYGGTGIGLALVARIVSRHGGRIWAEAAPGEGATFYFTLEGDQS